MAVNHGRTTADAHPETDPHAALYADGDRHCRHCREVALAFDPETGRPRCRSCGELT